MLKIKQTKKFKKDFKKVIDSGLDHQKLIIVVDALAWGVIEKEMENREVFKPREEPEELQKIVNPMTRAGKPRKLGIHGGIMGRPNSLNYDDHIKVMISNQDKKLLEAHCRQIGTDLSSKVRELIFKYMGANGLK